MLEKLQPIKKIYSNYSIFYIFEVISPHNFFKRNKIKKQKIILCAAKENSIITGQHSQDNHFICTFKPLFLESHYIFLHLFLALGFQVSFCGDGSSYKDKTKRAHCTNYTTAAAKCCTDHHCVAMVIDRQLQLDAHTGSQINFQYVWYNVYISDTK